MQQSQTTTKCDDAHETQKIICPHLLLVEGKDEVNLFNALLRHECVSSIQVEDIAGKNKLSSPEGLGAIKIRPGFGGVTRIGIVRDGDGNNKGAFDSVCSALEGANLPFPARPLELSDGKPRVSVMIMPPEEVESGQMLEDLCLAAIVDDPNTNTAMHCVDEFFNCLEDRARVSHKKNIIPKARLHAFLASRKDPVTSLGIAAQKGYIPLDSPVFEPVTNFLRQLTAN